MSWLDYDISKEANSVIIQRRNNSIIFPGSYLIGLYDE